MRNLPPPPVPPRLCEMLKGYPELIQAVQNDLTREVERLLNNPHFPAFEEAVWRLESLFDSLYGKADAEAEAAEASGDQQAIEDAKKKRNLISRTASARPWNDEGEGTLWDYFQAYKEAFE